MNKTINFTLPTLDHARRFAAAVDMLKTEANGRCQSEKVNAIILKFAAHCAAEMLRINETENLEGAAAFTESDAANAAINIISTLAEIVHNTNANPQHEEFINVVFDPYANADYNAIYNFYEMTPQQVWTCARNHASRLHIYAGNVVVETFRNMINGDSKTFDEIVID